MLLAIFAAQAWFAATRPITAAEALVFDRFVRPPLGETLHQPSGNGDVLYTLLEKRSIGLFHVSEFSLRLPALLAGAFYLWLVWRKGRYPLLMLALAAAPLASQCFSTASGLGLALSLAAWAMAGAEDGRLNRAGLFLGLAVAAHFAFLAWAIALGGIAVWRILQSNPSRTEQSNWRLAVERFLIPAVTVCFMFLVLPLSLAPDSPSVPPELGAGGINSVRTAVDVVRQVSGARPIRIASSPAISPVLSFYRARFRMGNRQTGDDAPDYYLQTEAGVDLTAKPGAVVLHRDGGIVLYR